MARKPAETAADGTPVKKPVRPVGPKTLYIVLKEGSDATAVNEAVESVTTNMRKVMPLLMGQTGIANAGRVISRTIAVDKRGDLE